MTERNIDNHTAPSTNIFEAIGSWMIDKLRGIKGAGKIGAVAVASTMALSNLAGCISAENSEKPIPTERVTAIIPIESDCPASDLKVEIINPEKDSDRSYVSATCANKLDEEHNKKVKVKDIYITNSMGKVDKFLNKNQTIGKKLLVLDFICPENALPISEIIPPKNDPKGIEVNPYCKNNHVLACATNGSCTEN